MQVETESVKESTAQFPWRIRLGTLFGLPLYLHISFFIWFLGLFWIEFENLVLYISLLVFSIGIHELAHALSCRSLGLGGGTLTIWLLGGYFIPFSELTLFEMTRKQRVQHAIMVFAGPLSNFLLAALFSLLAYKTTMNVFQVAAKFNLTIAVFNLLPAGRLDGGNIVIYLGSTFIHWRKAMFAVGILSFLVAGGVFVGIFLDSWIGNYSNWAGFLIAMGVMSIRMGNQTEEELKAESEKFVAKEKAIADETSRQSIGAKRMSSILNVGLLGMIVFSIWRLGSTYLVYDEMPGRIVYSDIDRDNDTLVLLTVEGLGFPINKAAGHPIYYPMKLSSSADGRFIAFVCTASRDPNLISMCVDDATGKAIAEIPLDESFREATALLSPTGAHVAISKFNGGVWVIDISTGSIKEIRQEGFVSTWTPEGDSILIDSDIDDKSEILQIGLNGSNVINITNNPNDDWSPVFSPDGKSLYFLSNRDGADALYRMNTDGKNIITIILENNVYTRNSPLQISPDGAKILFECGPVGGIICIANADGKGEKQLGYGKMPTWSPDGRFIAFESDYLRQELLVMLPNGASPQSIAPLDTWISYFLWLP